jgi:hypothetical protein
MRCDLCFSRAIETEVYAVSLDKLNKNIHQTRNDQSKKGSRTLQRLDFQKSDKPDTEEKAKEKFQQRRNYVM